MNALRWASTSVQWVGISASILLLAAACGDSGSEGNLRFLDQSGASDQVVLPIAEGRAARYTIRSSGLLSPTVNVETATSSDEKIIKVEKISNAEVTVLGLATGKARLEVLAENGRRDSIELEVREEANTFYETVSINDSTSVVPGLIHVRGKYNVRNGDSLTFERPVFTDKDGVRLSGIQQATLGTPETSGSMKVELGADDSVLTIEAGAVDDTASLSNAYGDSLMIRTTDIYAPKSLTAVRYGMPILRNIQRGLQFRMPDGIYNFRVFPVDADGYAYLGNFDMDARVELSSADGVAVTPLLAGDDATENCTKKDSEDRCTEWEGMSSVAFNMIRGKEAASSLTLTVTTGGVTQAFTIELPASATPSE